VLLPVIGGAAGELPGPVLSKAIRVVVRRDRGGSPYPEELDEALVVITSRSTDFPDVDDIITVDTISPPDAEKFLRDRSARPTLLPQTKTSLKSSSASMGCPWRWKTK